MRRFAMAIVLFLGSIAATAPQFSGTTPSSFSVSDLPKSARVDFGVLSGVYLLGPLGLELSATVRPA